MIEEQPGNTFGGLAQASQQQQVVKRGKPDVDEGRRKLVSGWQSNIKEDKRHYADVYKRMRKNMEMTKLGADKAWVEAGNYTVPIIGRHINQAVSSLYAKNPKAVAKRRPRLNFKLWDGSMQSAQAALQGAAMGDPNSIAILQEIEEAKANNQMLTRLAKTMEILFEYYTGESTPTFKKQMKQHVRRAKTCGVAFMEVVFQRVLEPSPDITAQIDDMTNQIAVIESQLADAADSLIGEGDAQLEQLRLNLRDLQEQEMILVREGLSFDFMRSTEIIPHKKCRQLSGFIGADYVTREFHMDVDEIQETYKVDVSSSYVEYTGEEGGKKEDRSATKGATGGRKNDDKKSKKACVWRVQDRKNRQVFTLVEGYPDFVKEPEPNPLQVDGFYTIFALTFNDIEDEDEVFPYSDAHHLEHPQREFNNARQGLREHRKANRPKYFVRAGALDEKEREHLKNHEAHAVIELKGMDSETPIDSMITGFKSVPIDPTLYETKSIINDVLIGVGTQDANLGPTSGATATESSISEQSRQTGLSSNVDDLDEHLSDIARASAQVMLAELSGPTVEEIVGPGAVWPELNREQISKELFLEIKAGSSGRPNKAAELANMERGMPYLIQLPGIKGETLGSRYADLLDIDLEELIVEGMPSIVALNAMATKQASQPQPGPGAGKDDPNQQGAQGSNNAGGPGQRMNENEPGGQPGYPAPQPQ